MDREPRREEIQPIMVDELKIIRDLAMDNIYEIEDIHLEKDNEDIKDRDINDRVEKLVSDLLDIKDRMKFVFSTESGSLYFVLNSGQCLRIKKEKNNKDMWSYKSVQPIAEKIYFVSDESGEKAKRLNRLGSSWRRSRDGVVEDEFGGDRTIVCSQQIMQGLRPLEINMIHQNVGLAIKDHGNTFEIIGRMKGGVKIEDSGNTLLVGAIHMGHKIDKIIK